MSKTTYRRERKLADTLRKLAEGNPARFREEWDRLLICWCEEARRRGNLLRREAGDTREVVFGALAKAERVLAMTGPKAERLVGAKARELLAHDCARAFAHAVEPSLYRPGNSAHNELLMKLGTHTP